MTKRDYAKIDLMPSPLSLAEMENVDGILFSFLI